MAIAPAASFIGREHELDALRTALEATKSGSGSFFLISGPPGIGKSRLVEETESIAVREGFSVFWGRCWDSRSAPAFWPWIQVIRAAVEDLGSGDVAANVRLAIEQRFLMKAAAASGGDSAARGGEEGAAMSSGAASERFELFDSVVKYLRALSGRKSVLLVFDDIHQADDDSLLLLDFVTTGLRRSPIMVIANVREKWTRRDKRFEQVLSKLSRAASRIALPRLTTDESVELSRSIIGRDLNAEEIATLDNVAEGNPLFIREILLRNINATKNAGQGELTPSSVVVPETVLTVMGASISILSAPARKILTAAAIVGRQIDVALLRRLVPFSFERISSGLDEASRAGLLESSPHEAAPYQFSHHLVAESLLAALSPAERRRLHLMAAEAIEAETINESSRTFEIAHHYFESLPIGSVDKAVSAAVRAASVATGQMAYAEAARLFQTALAADKLGEPQQPRRRCRLLLGLGRSQCWSEDYDSFRGSFASAADLARGLDDGELFGRAVLGFAMIGNYDAPDPDVVQMLEEAVERVGPADSPLRASLLARLAEEIRRSGSGLRSKALIDEAIDIARRTDSPEELAQGLYLKLHSLRGPRNGEEHLALSADLLQLVEARSLRSWRLRAHYHRAAILLEFGMMHEFYGEVEAMRRIPPGLRFGTEGLSFAEIDDIVGSMIALFDGDASKSELLAKRAFASGQRRPNSVSVQIYFLQLMSIRREQGRLAELIPTIESLVASSPQQALGHCVLAYCRAELGWLEPAKAAYKNLIASELQTIPDDFTWMASVAFLVEACVSTNDIVAADLLYGRLKPFEKRNVVIGCFSYLGSVSYYLALLATSLSNLQLARSHFEATLRSHTLVGARFWIARTRFQFARMLLALSSADTAEAIEHLDACRAEAEILGSVDLLAKANALKASVATSAALSPESQSPGERRGRKLTTIMFTDIVESTRRVAMLGDRDWSDLLDSFYAVMRHALARRRGREISTAGDGFLAVFDEPSDAVRCSLEVERGLAPLGLSTRVGIHTGECEFIGADVRGLSVHIAARVAAAAEPGQVLLSAVAKELATGSTLQFVDRGLHELKGVDGEWRLFSPIPRPDDGDAHPSGRTQLTNPTVSKRKEPPEGGS